MIRAVASILLLSFLFGIALCQFYVSPNGLDSSSCGSATTPCRSIACVVERAQGGEIMVEEGRYQLTAEINLEKNLSLISNSKNTKPIIDLKLLQGGRQIP